MLGAGSTIKKQHRRRRYLSTIRAQQRQFVFVQSQTQVSASLQAHLPNDVADLIASEAIAAQKEALFSTPMKREVDHVLTKQLKFSNKEEERRKVAAGKVEAMFAQVARSVSERSERPLVLSCECSRRSQVINYAFKDPNCTELHKVRYELTQNAELHTAVMEHLREKVQDMFDGE